MPVFQLSEQLIFPPPELAEENGLLAIGGDLRPERLIMAYSQGIFPWYSEGDPLLWWFTSPRLVLFTKELKIPKRLARKIRQAPFRITFDQAFDKVVTACANSRKHLGEETWIVPEMITAYVQLYHLGYAHSVECWQEDALVGGLYGIQLDKVFFGESMFTTVSDASKIALVTLVNHLQKTDVEIIDCQMTTEHLLRFGAREISGNRFLQLLKRLINSTPKHGKWKNERYDSNNK